MKLGSTDCHHQPKTRGIIWRWRANGEAKQGAYLSGEGGTTRWIQRGEIHCDEEREGKNLGDQRSPWQITKARRCSKAERANSRCSTFCCWLLMPAKDHLNHSPGSSNFQ
jgi:hypothetical protein